MNYLTIDQWDTRDLKSTFLNRLRTESFDKIFIFTQNEYQFDTAFDEFLYPFLGHYIETKGLNVDLITSVIPALNTAPKFKGLNIHHWDTYWLTKTYSILQEPRLVTERQQQEINFTNIKYPFIMMNNRAHDFRAKLIDYVAKENLVDKAAISWNNTDSFLMNSYTFKHYDGKNRVLDEKYKTPLGGQYCPPNQYYESFAQLVSESNPKIIFFSEKISMALLIGKPFLAAAGAGIHDYLNKRMGIKYYHEVFDYSFDFETDMEKRWKLIVDNFVRLSKLSINELNDLHNQIKDKIIFNKNRAIEVATDTSFMPLPIREYFEIYKTDKTIVNRHLCAIFDNLYK